jgi:hypothetical protein
MSGNYYPFPIFHGPDQFREPVLCLGDADIRTGDDYGYFL